MQSTTFVNVMMHAWKSTGPEPRRANEALLVALLALSAAYLAACRHAEIESQRQVPPHPAGAVARSIKADEGQFAGPVACARTGDMLIANPRMRFAIATRARNSIGELLSGCIVDAAPCGAANDHFGRLGAAIGTEFLSPVAYDKVELLDSCADGTVGVKAKGHDVVCPEILITTEYTLSAGSNCLRVLTKVTNVGNRTLQNVKLGDTVLWGLSLTFAPTTTAPGDRGSDRLPWIAAARDGVCYGLFMADGEIRVRRHDDCTEVWYKTVDLRPFATVNYERFFTVGEGGASAVSDVYQVHGRMSYGRVEATALEEPGGRGIRGATVRCFSPRDQLRTYAVTDKNGHASFLLFPAEWHFDVSAPHHRRTSVLSFRVDQDHACIFNVGMERKPRLVISVAEEQPDGKLRPREAKVTIERRDGPDPYLGQPFEPSGAGNTVLVPARPTSVSLEPGEYVLTASRGPLYTTEIKQVQLTGGEPGSVDFRLKRLFPLAEYASCDPHVHTCSGMDCPVGPRARLLSCLAEGLDMAVFADARPGAAAEEVLADANGANEMSVVSGVQLSGARFGRMSLLPFSPDRRAPCGAGLLPVDVFTILRRLRPKPYVVLNDPFDPRTGYFRLVGMDYRTGAASRVEAPLDFDAVELISGRGAADLTARLENWFGLLNAGLRVVAVGGSGSYGILGQETGYARTLILNPPLKNGGLLAGEALATMLRDGRCVVTNGPVLRMFVQGNGAIGSVVRARAETVDVAVEVSAAPWIDVSSLRIYRNGRKVVDVRVRSANDEGGFAETYRLPVPRDSWFVALVRGERGLHPVLQGKGEHAVLPFAFTNPVWVDVDGDGLFSRIPED